MKAWALVNKYNEIVWWKNRPVIYRTKNECIDNSFFEEEVPVEIEITIKETNNDST